MDGFINFMEKHFIPTASKIGAQRHLVAIRDAFMVTMPLMILGSLAVLLNNLPIPGFQELMNSIFGGEAWKGFGGSVWNGTFAILSVLIAFLIAHNLLKGYGKDGVAGGVVSVASFFALGGATGMSSNGLFIALIVGITSAEIFNLLVGNPKLIVKMPDGVPPAVAKSFAALFPAMITISIYGLIAAIFAGFGVTDIIASFYELVQKPFMGLASTWPSALLLAFITPFLWFFGLHGANMIEPLMQSINLPAITANQEAIAAGDEAPYIVNKPFFDSFVNLGGTGATLGLIIAIYLFGRRNKAHMVVTNLSAAPGIFNINEPMMFGLPIVLNPIMFVPFVLTPMILVTVAYFATSTGLVPAAIAMPPWVTPPIIGGFIATNSIAGGVLAAVNLVIAIVIYAPFVKIAEIQELKKEQAI
ncbi:PTS lactose transporter subunit IIC [Carnobacterium maltaromaticum]|uniref:PTS sugar transporter subunit IIC n=1 Tax=Carnobacterium maltaromaticum TaxID=2751 RepID=UPI000C77294D|nr:PTS sugar transporter subunit IIC [Carnobacterium maltaromaticum]PLS36774.1 PTS lactose transporter subunit IIC [Carnobacterium maltaromaticum]PLS37589.1 PTS lactose transporter subunit IIC [Carnobacterium maltaromaticum]PLS39531.1 PTS lactose transporter subunit IIC [Carnobacterium maltaromaticum]PLS44286.1 PTS lactose transporter subunit IIC [Carnobacterium maltaromaticum]PLS46320.1 PTS lactose transporter subunit IIC [Carnobacterium maltaromaticum]